MPDLSIKPSFCLWLLAALLCFHSCYWPEKEEVPRKTTCIQAGAYDYLENELVDSICTTELCSTYTAIWKELFMQENRMTEAYFNTHISITYSTILKGYSGENFYIHYRVTNDWAIAEGGDILRIYMTTVGDDFPDINLPLGQYLSLENLQLAIQHHGTGSRINKAPKTGPLKYRSRQEAMYVLLKEANVDKLCFNRIFLSHHLGTLTLEAYGRYEDEDNVCVKGTIDLITGSIDIDEDKDCDRIWGH